MKSNTEFSEVKGFDCGLYRSWGGGILLKLACDRSDPRTLVLQSELVFAFKEHLVRSIADAQFSDPKKRDDKVDLARSQSMPPTVSASDFTLADSESAVTGWTWHVDPNAVIVEFKFQRGSPEVYLFTSEIVFSLLEVINRIITDGYLTDLRDFRKLTEHEMEQEVLLSEGYRLTQAFEHFARSRRLLERNYADLKAHLDQFDGLISNPDFTLWVRRHSVDIFMDEVLRLLHNFVASCKSLIDHSRVFFNRLSKESRPFPGYAEEIKFRFADDPLHQFIVGLREFLQHYRLPGIKTSKTFGSDGVQGKVLLSKKDLLCFSGWKSQAKSFLNYAKDDINIVAVLDSYNHKIIQFHTWLQREWNKTFWFELHEAELKRQALLAKRGEVRVASLRTSLAGLNVGKTTDLATFFSEVLSAEELHELQEFEAEPAEFVRRAVRYAERRLFLPSDLKQQLLDLGQRRQPKTEDRERKS